MNHHTDMRKTLFTAFAFGALLLPLQAQQQGGITPKMLESIRQTYQGTPADKALRNAIGGNDIRTLALNRENLTGMDTHFSIRVESKGILAHDTKTAITVMEDHINKVVNDVAVLKHDYPDYFN